jgi:AAA domain
VALAGNQYIQSPLMRAISGGDAPGVNGQLPRDDAEFRREVERYKNNIRAREIARREVAAEMVAKPVMVGAVSGEKFLAEEDADPVYLVEGLWPMNGNVILAAQYKAGKTTLTGNLLRSLCDGTDFLSQYRVTPGRVLLVDFELARRQARQWLAEQEIGNPDRFEYLNLRGQASAFGVMTPAGQEKWAGHIAPLGVSAVIVDCLAPLMNALGLDEHRDGRKLCEGIQATMTLAGVENIMIVHHMGHAAERARGDSGLRDWPDAEWRLLRQEDDPASPRFLTAYGRDIDVPEMQLTYDPVTRHLTVAGGSRAEAKASTTETFVLEYVTANTGSSGRDIEEAAMTAGHTEVQTRAAIKSLVKNNLIGWKPGPRNAHLHYPVR